MAALHEGKEIVASLFIRLFSDRFEDFGTQYNPELPCPLDDNEVQQFHDSVVYIIDSDVSELSEIIERFYSAITDFIDEHVTPSVENHIGHPHFLRSFSTFLHVLETVGNDLEFVLPPEFPDREDLSRLLARHAEQVVCSKSEDDLLSAVFTGLNEIRISEEYDGPLDQIIHIGRRFANLPEHKWKVPYFEHLKTQTASFANGLEINDTTFVDMAFERAEKEETNAESIGLCGIEGRGEARKVVFDAFCEIYNPFAELNPEMQFTWLFENVSEDTQDRFQNLLRLYGDAGEHNVNNILKERIRANCDFIVNTLRAQNNEWDMESLEAAIAELAEYEENVYDRVRPGVNRGIRHLQRTLNREFQRLFNGMFRWEAGWKRPEEFLADFVEYVVSKDGGGNIEEWRKQYLGYVHMLMKYAQRKDVLVDILQRRIQAYNPLDFFRRNNAFLSFLEMRQVKYFVSPEFKETLTNSLNTGFMTMPEFKNTKMKIILIQSSEPMVGGKDQLVANLLKDSKCVFTVSVPYFCGARKSIYLRLTALQMEILNTMLAWKDIYMKQIYSLFIRDDIEGNVDAAKTNIDSVVESLMSPNLPLLRKILAGSQYGDTHVIQINDEYVVQDPYSQVGPVAFSHVQLSHDERFLVDNAIEKILREKKVSDMHELSQCALNEVQVPLNVIQERIRRLQQRRFLTKQQEPPQRIRYVES